MTTTLLRWLAASALLSCIALPSGGALGDPFAAIPDEDRAALEALSLYPEDLRRSILEATTEAHVLTELSTRQEQSRESFRGLLDPYEQSTQEQLFQLTRYPTLVSEIVEGGPKDRDELDVIAARYPEEVRDAARGAGAEHWKLVSRVHALLSGQQAAFENLVGDLPPEKQTAFLALLDTPEVLALLGENRTMAVLLGDAYERDPDGVAEAFDALQQEVAERNADEAREFVEEVEADPELRSEVESSYEEYEQEYSGGDSYEQDPVSYAPQPTPQVNVTVQVVRPYSYWVGVPWWISSGYSYYDPWVHWYPRPYWRHCGYRFGPRFPVVYGAPRYGFYGWYFNRPVHHYRYPKLSNHFLYRHDRYGYGHGYGRRHWRRGHRRAHYGAGGYAIGRFVRDVERDMPAGFLRAGKDRPARLAEYGKLENDLRRSYRKAGKNGKKGRDRQKDRRRDLDKLIAERPGDYPGLSKLAADEKAGLTKKERRSYEKAAKAERREDKKRIRDEKRDEKKQIRTEKRDEKKRVQTEKRDEKKRIQTEKRTEKQRVRTEKREEKQRVRDDKKRVQTEKRAEKKRAKTERRDDKQRVRDEKKRVRTEKRDDKKQVRTEKRDEKKRVQAEERARREQQQRQRNEQKRIQQQQRNDQKRAQQQQRNEQKRIQQQQRDAQRRAEQQRRASEQQARAQRQAAEKQARQQRQAEKKRTKQQKKADRKQAKKEKRESR